MLRLPCDAYDGDFFAPDNGGHDLEDFEAAKLTAQEALPNMAEDKLADGDHCDLYRQGEGRSRTDGAAGRADANHGIPVPGSRLSHPLPQAALYGMGRKGSSGI